MILNRVSQYLDLPNQQFGSAISETSRQQPLPLATSSSEGRGPLSAFDVNRIAWEQARQMVRAKQQLRNRVARFF